MEKNIHYGCSGCGAEITEKQFLAGQTTCQDESCERCGEPLEKMEYCASCDEYYDTNEAERHSSC